jgi:tRNA-dihydrouridine synthase A
LKARASRFYRSPTAAGSDALIVHAQQGLAERIVAEGRSRHSAARLRQGLSAETGATDVPVVINGGIASIAEARHHLAHVDGVTLGRAAYQEPWRLLSVDPEIFGEPAPFAAIEDAFAVMMPYIKRELCERRAIRRATQIGDANRKVAIRLAWPGSR